MAIPIAPGQTERWLKFSNALKNEKFNEWKASRVALGVRERTFLQRSPMGDFVLVTLEGEDPQSSFVKFGQGTDAFTNWFKAEVKEIHGLDLANPPQGPMPELIVDSGELSASSAK